VKDVKPEYHRNLDYLVGLLDWDANVNPEFGRSNRCFPKPVKPLAETQPDGFREQWICYGTGYYSAKELTVLPKRSVTIRDRAAYGIILTQGHGKFGKLAVSTPSMIRLRQMTAAELSARTPVPEHGGPLENTPHDEP